jgi:signal transduction histidine kinase
VPSGRGAWPKCDQYFTGASRAQGSRERPTLPWTVVVRQPIEIAHALAAPILDRLVLGGATFALFFALLGWWAAHVRGTAERKGLGLHIEADGHDPRVLGDVTRLRQVLLNLVNNAVKFTAHGSVTVALSQSETPDGVAAHVKIRDPSIGISAETHTRLFNRFVQADSSTTRRFGGTGLGPAIAKGLIAAMGGEIGVDSREGSTFWFSLTLPRASEVEARAIGWRQRPRSQRTQPACTCSW